MVLLLEADLKTAQKLLQRAVFASQMECQPPVVQAQILAVLGNDDTFACKKCAERLLRAFRNPAVIFERDLRLQARQLLDLARALIRR